MIGNRIVKMIIEKSHMEWVGVCDTLPDYQGAYSGFKGCPLYGGEHPD